MTLRDSYLEMTGASNFGAACLLEAYDSKLSLTSTGTLTFDEVYTYCSSFVANSPVTINSYAYFEYNSYVQFEGNTSAAGGIGFDTYSNCWIKGNPATDSFSTVDLEIYTGSKFYSNVPVNVESVFMYGMCGFYTFNTVSLSGGGYIDCYDNSTMKVGGLGGSLDYVAVYHGGEFVCSGSLSASINYVECYAGRMSFLYGATTFGNECCRMTVGTSTSTAQ